MLANVALGTLLVVFMTACASGEFSGRSGVSRGSGDRLPEKRPEGQQGPQPSLGSEGNADEIASPEAAEPAVPDEALPPAKTPKFALLLNKLECAMCHVTVNGDIVSTASAVGGWSTEHAGLSDERVTGRWLAAGTWTNRTAGGSTYNISVAGGVKESYRGPEMPSSFPTLDFAGAARRATGKLRGKSVAGDAVSLVGASRGHLALAGTASAPIQIEGSIAIDGDVVIFGSYEGIGTIYASGNIYVPASLTGRQDDALGLASNNAILVGRLDSRIFDEAIVPPGMDRESLGVDRVYGWFPSGEDGYSRTYAQSQSVEIDAYLYALKSVAGRVRGTWTINGGVIADSMHLLGGTGSGQRNVINYDHRMRQGLPILSELGRFFE